MMYSNESGRICTLEPPKIDKESKHVEIYVDPSMSFWQKDQKLYWRFSNLIQNEELKIKFRKHLSNAESMWGGALKLPIALEERTEYTNVVDFEVIYKKNPAGELSLANVFLPTTQKSVFEIYDRFISQDENTQLNIIAHELGHIYGLRHTFIDYGSETDQIQYGGSTDSESVMNTNASNPVTSKDRAQLWDLYTNIWSKKTLFINGVAVTLVLPYHCKFE